jgi:hypothetical protein
MLIAAGMLEGPLVELLSMFISRPGVNLVKPTRIFPGGRADEYILVSEGLNGFGEFGTVERQAQAMPESILSEKPKLMGAKING